MRDGFYAALEAAGLSHLREQDDPIVFHDLRHTFGTLACRSAGDRRAGVHGAQRHQADDALCPSRAEARRRRAVLALRRKPNRVPLCPEPVTSGTTERNTAQLKAA
jgi:hypothetical protein